MTFTELGLSAPLLAAITRKGFEEPTPIQEKVIPLLMQSDLDIVGQAQTGTGKTAAFGLPMIEKLDPRDNRTQALILAPTRELAIQVAEEINSFRHNRELHVLPVYGGQFIDRQIRKLKQGVQIVVGTPGRILDHLRRKSLNLQALSFLVLDEADEMLNMGFIEDVEAIMEQTGSNKRVLLFSATIPGRILQLAEKYMHNYQTIRTGGRQVATELADQIYFEVAEADKFEALCRIIDMEDHFYALVFCRTKVSVDETAGRLLDRGYDAEALHGDLAQNQREKILEKFRNKRINILVATDVAARGLDIVRLSHVINFSLPQDPDSYIHRIGRTGRAGESGTAVTFVTPAEYKRLLYIKRMAKAEIRREKIPAVKEIINRKKLIIREELQEIIETGDYTTYLAMAEDLLEENSGLELVAALLKYSFQEELDEKNYSNIKEVSVDRKGRTRLFIAKGRTDGMNKKKLVDFIINKSGVPGHKIQGAQVYEQFSFINVPFQEAEIILAAFRKGGRRSIVEVAKQPKK